MKIYDTKAKEYAEVNNSKVTPQKYSGSEKASRNNQSSKALIMGNASSKEGCINNIKIISLKEFYDLTGCKSKRKLSVKEMQEIVGSFPENRKWYLEFNKHFKAQKEHINQVRKHHGLTPLLRNEKQDQINRKRHTTDPIKRCNEQKYINLKEDFDEPISSYVSVSVKS